MYIATRPHLDGRVGQDELPSLVVGVKHQLLQEVLQGHTREEVTAG
jgi:hypothetical protein